MRRIVASIGAASVLALVFAMPVAGANPPVHEPISDEGEFVIAECDGFNLVETFSITGHATIFFDKQGNEVRIKEHINYTGSIFNSVTGDFVASDPGKSNNTIDLVNGTFTQTGLIFNIHVDGRLIVHDVGKIVFDLDTFEVIVVHGPHDVFELGDGIDWCALLA